RAGKRAGDDRLHDAGGGVMESGAGSRSTASRSPSPLHGEEMVADTLRKLAVVFADFEQRLEATPLIRKLTRGRFELADYHAFLINLRQQVKDGALWMSRAASNIDEAHLELRSTLMRHAVTEHRDFRLLEADYVGRGGDVAVIRAGEKNVGSEALSAWMFHEASKPNPFGLLGAMWIIEGLGSIKAQEWGRRVKETL